MDSLIASSLINEEYIQWGFAGFCLILVGVIVWLIKTYNKINSDNNASLVDVIQKNNKVLARLFDGLNAVKESDDQVKYSVEKLNESQKESAKDLLDKVNDLRELILSRPCLRKEGQYVSK